jgi:hypothetical protein
MKTPCLQISDHAILRYLERAIGIDMDRIRADMLTPRRRSAILKLGDGKYPVSRDCRAVVVDRVVVTILGPGQK